jgi:sulfur dioxygenase
MRKSDIPCISNVGRENGQTVTVASQPTLLLRQLFDRESSAYTYLIADPTARVAILVDPVLEQVERDLRLLQELELTLWYCLETHIHGDHITGASKLREATRCQLLVPAQAGVIGADREVVDGERLQLGAVSIDAISTPGHTLNHMAYFVNGTSLIPMRINL